MVSITEVELVTVAASEVWSTFSPFLFFDSIPNNSMKAPRVPDPSSLETMLIVPLDEDDESFEHPARMPIPIRPDTAKRDSILCFFMMNS